MRGLSWADRRRAIVLLILAAIGLSLLFFTYHTAFYRAPSCTDGIQNQGEAGIDCGGPCQYLCSTHVQPPTAQFVRPLANGGNRTDIIAYIDNPNPAAAAAGATYSVQLYGTDGALLAQKSGTVDLPPHSTVPVFMPNFYNGAGQAANAFITFDQASLKWFLSTTSPQTLPVSNIQVAASTSTPNVTATITNPTALPFYNVRVVVVVLGASSSSNNVIAASQTVVPSIPAQGTAPLTFTWSVPFAGTPVREEIFPIVPLAHP